MTTPNSKKPEIPLIAFPENCKNVETLTGDEWWKAAGKTQRLLKQGGIVVLFGHRGPGKTQIAYEVAKDGDFPNPFIGEVHPQRRPAIYLTAMDCFLKIRDSWRKDAEMSELELLDEWRNAALLVIDEIQERGETDFENQKLTAIVDARYRDMRPTLLIGNFRNAQEMAAGISPSILSRIQETGGAIHCDWPSFRSTPR